MKNSCRKRKRYSNPLAMIFRTQNQKFWIFQKGKKELKKKRKYLNSNPKLMKILAILLN